MRLSISSTVGIFRYEVFALLAESHKLLSKKYLTAKDFAHEMLITYPIPNDRIDIIREVLKPAGIEPVQRTTELTVAILQLVASRRGIAALPSWAVQPFLDKHYIQHRRIRKNGLFANLYAVTTQSSALTTYMVKFIQTMQKVSFQVCKDIEVVQ